MERLPTEVALVATTQEFKNIQFKSGKSDKSGKSKE
jgi:hypothetical protein